jgi:aminoglycoside 6'-N-acetyltransferase I
VPKRYGLAIRAADAGDAEGIAKLLHAAGFTVEPRGLALRLHEIPAQSGLVLLAEEWGPPRGVLALHWHWTLLDDVRIAELTILAVDPEQRRKGVARLLLKAAARAARSAGCAELRVTVPSLAEDLSSFCAATGFNLVGDTFARPLRKRGQSTD